MAVSGRAIILATAGTCLALAAALAYTVSDALTLRYRRDVSRMVFNDNLQLLTELRQRVGLESDSLAQLLANPAPPTNRPYIVVSIEENRLWYRDGDSVLFTAPVATGSGKTLERTAGGTHWRFETPRGRLSVVSRDTAPIWVAPDWHYVEEAQRRGLGVVRLLRGQRLPTTDGGWIGVRGSDMVVADRSGRISVAQAGPEGEFAWGGNIIIPPFGTNQRKYPGVLGTHRLNLGNGYAIHGTNRPETIGRSVSHGCIRLRNDDIAALYSMVQAGTPVFIY
jgi:hypothetical protein